MTELDHKNGVMLRCTLICMSLFADALIFVTLRNDPALRNSAVETFFTINVSILLCDLGVTLIWLRRPSRHTRVMIGTCIAFEALTIVVWIQVTGSISSYFISVAVFLILAYRLFFDYWLALVMLVCMIVMHVGAYVLEEIGLLPIASLFLAEPSGIYDSVAFRRVVMLSIAFVYIGVFLVGNRVVLKLREKDSALRCARERLLQVVNAAQLGRLSGHVLSHRYELGEVLGRGGMGEVYAARLLDNNRRVAIKLLHTHLTDDPSVVARFKREVFAVQQLPPSCAAEVLELGESADGQHYIAMEHLPGEDLGALLRRHGRLSVEQVVNLAQRLARILDIAHSAGIVHRDIKPSNIFVTDCLDHENSVRLLDFGVSRLRHADIEFTLTDTSAVLGSPGYLAPEQAQAQAEKIGPRTDLFALGAVLYRALTGEAAFPSRSIASAIHEAVHWSPPAPCSLLPELPHDIDTVFDLAMAKASEDRFASAAELAQALALASRGALDANTRQRGHDLCHHRLPVDTTLTGQTM